MKAKRHLHLTDEEWDKLRDLNRVTTANLLRGKLPSDWGISEGDVSGAVYDTIIHLLQVYKPGSLSPVSYCWRYVEIYTLRDLLREYRHCKDQLVISDREDPEDEDGNVHHEIGVGDVPGLTTGRSVMDDQMDVRELLDRATEDDRKIMVAVMDGKSLREIGSEMGLSKNDVARRLRRYAKSK